MTPETRNIILGCLLTGGFAIVASVAGGFIQKSRPESKQDQPAQWVTGGGGTTITANGDINFLPPDVLGKSATPSPSPLGAPTPASVATPTPSVASTPTPQPVATPVATSVATPTPIPTPPSEEFHVSGRCGLGNNKAFDTGINIQKGDYVTIEASDEISVGANIGSTGPDGVNIINLPLIGPQPISRGYYIVSSTGLGGLLWRVGTAEQWHPCGSSMQKTFNKSGRLYFNVNDNIQNDNNGAFTVNVTVTHHKS